MACCSFQRRLLASASMPRTVAVAASQVGLRRVDRRLLDGDRGPVGLLVQLDEKIAAVHPVVVVDEDARDLAADAGGNEGHVAVHERVVGRNGVEGFHDPRNAERKDAEQDQAARSRDQQFSPPRGAAALRRGRPGLGGASGLGAASARDGEAGSLSRSVLSLPWSFMAGTFHGKADWPAAWGHSGPRPHSLATHYISTRKLLNRAATRRDRRRRFVQPPPVAGFRDQAAARERRSHSSKPMWPRRASPNGTSERSSTRPPQ